MKRGLSFLVLLALLLTGVMLFTGVALAEAELTDEEAAALAAREAEILNSTQDNMAIGGAYEIPGYASVEPVWFSFIEAHPQFLPGMKGDRSELATIASGTKADYAWFLVDITNLAKEDHVFSEDASVQYIFDNDYILDGWIRQFNYDYDESIDPENPIYTAFDPEDTEPIAMLYTGHYVFGCTAPTAVVTGTEPLSAIITLDGNEFIYNIRK